MSCFPCFKSQRSKKSLSKKEDSESKKGMDVAEAKDCEGENKYINARTYNFRELATATKNFRQECLLGEGGFGKVFKGTFQSTGQVVAVKQLDRHGLHGSKEFLAEISSLSLLHSPNVVNLIGYCADGDQRILVYEYMSGGSLESHLFAIKEQVFTKYLFAENGPKNKPLDWFTRIKIVSGVARGLEYLHEHANPPVIYSYLKASNILLDEEFNPKLSDIGLTKLSPSGDEMQGPSRMMATYGYSAPEYTSSGEVSLKSDVYSFGVVLLEIITGRRAVDTTRPSNEQNLVTWAHTYFRDPKKYPELADPNLQGQFPEKDLNQAVAVAAMCLQEEASVRPLISDVVTTLSFLTTIPPEGFYPPAPAPAPETRTENQQDQDDEDNKSLKDDDTYSKQSENDVSGEDENDDDVDVVSDDGDGDESDTRDDNSEDESEETTTTTEAKELDSKSSRKSYSSSDDESDSSSCSGSSKFLDASLSASSRSIDSSNISALSRKSSKGSHRLSQALSHKKSKKCAGKSDFKGQRSIKAAGVNEERLS